MASSHALHRLATNPTDYMRFQTTGRMPVGVRPRGPLVDLLRAIPTRELSLIIGVTVDQRLGYTGGRQFHFAAQALRWVAPANEVFDGFPAESYRIKRFASKLYLDDLALCCASFPAEIFDRNRHLRRPHHPQFRAAPGDENCEPDATATPAM